MGIVRNRDAFAAGYTITPVSRTNKTILEISNDYITDVRLTRDLLDYNYFFKNCLVTVNGYYHRIDTDGVNGIFVLDGSKTLKRSNENQIGITNFKDVGGITTYSFSEVDKVLNNNGTIKISIPTTLVPDMSNKTFMMVYGGYMINVDSNSLIQLDDNIYKLDLATIPLVDMYYESKKYLNFDNMPVETTINNDNVISTQQLYSDGNIDYMLKLSQSFIIIVDTPTLNIEKKYVRTTGFPGQYISYIKPEYPLVLGNGRHVEYWVNYEDTQYSLTVNGYLNNRLIYNTANRNNDFSSSSNINVDDKDNFSKGYLLKISN